jgi:hypothetical protein
MMFDHQKAAIVALHLFQLAASFVLLAAVLTAIGGAL